MLLHGIPSPTPPRESLSDPLGISFSLDDSNSQRKLDLEQINFEEEISWMRSHLPTHPLIGTVVTNQPTNSAGPDTAPNGNSRAPAGRRRSSVGGDRASAIVAQFEVADVEVDPIQPISDEEMEEEYPESGEEGSGSYFDDIPQSDNVSLDLPPVRR